MFVKFRNTQTKFSWDQQRGCDYAIKSMLGCQTCCQGSQGKQPCPLTGKSAVRDMSGRGKFGAKIYTIHTMMHTEMPVRPPVYIYTCMFTSHAFRHMHMLHMHRQTDRQTDRHMYTYTVY